MQFGKLDYIPSPWQDPTLDSFRFLFTATKRSKPLTVYLGTPRLPDASWVGPVFPKGTRRKDFLKNYLERFNTFELNASFYGINPRTFELFAEQMVPDFKLSVKLPQSITHYRRLEGYEEVLDRLLTVVEPLHANLAPTLAQLPENMKADRLARIQRFISTYPHDLPLALEFRHPDFFEPVLFSELMHLLAEHKRTAVITDTPGKRHVLHTYFTAPTAFIRFNGTGDPAFDKQRLLHWLGLCYEMQQYGMEVVYFMIHESDPILGVQLIEAMRAEIQHRNDHRVVSPIQGSAQQQTLFG